jgi:hypothetical protein
MNCHIMCADFGQVHVLKLFWKHVQSASSPCFEQCFGIRVVPLFARSNVLVILLLFKCTRVPPDPDCAEVALV